MTYRSWNLSNFYKNLNNNDSLDHLLLPLDLI